MVGWLLPLQDRWLDLRRLETESISLFSDIRVNRFCSVQLSSELRYNIEQHPIPEIIVDQSGWPCGHGNNTTFAQTSMHHVQMQLFLMI